MGYLVIVLLAIALIIFVTKYVLIKRELKSVIRQLDKENTDLVTSQLVDNDLSEVVHKINILLDKVQQTIIKESKASALLKSSVVNISHDMKTPLTSVIGYLQLVDKEPLERDVKEMIEICLERTKYCNALINDFFELSLIESDGCNPDMDRIDVVEELCEQILANYPIFQQRGIEPHFEDAEKTIIVEADKMMLQRVIQNLISNAVKYSAGDIFFNVQEKENIMFTISNPVFGEIDTEHIFDKFYMQDKSRNDGRGIGLYLCKEFVESMQGSICAKMSGNILTIEVIFCKGE